MPKFDENKTYASCPNPNGAISLPVGEVVIVTLKEMKTVMYADVVTGYDLNYIFEHYEKLGIKQIIFHSPTTSKIIYREV